MEELPTTGLRPVEALYLLHCSYKERRNSTNNLAAGLSPLLTYGIIQPIEPQEGRKVHLEVTDKGLAETSQRYYEYIMMQGILEDKPRKIYEAVNYYNFRRDMVEKDFFEKVVITKKFLGVEKREKVEFHPTKKYGQTIKELLELKEEIRAGIENETTNPHLINMSYAFPSEAFHLDAKSHALQVQEAMRKEEIGKKSTNSIF